MTQRRFNGVVARSFRDAARLLEGKQGLESAEEERRRFRVAAYRRGAKVVEALREDVSEILARRGVGGLKALRWIGVSLAASIEEIVTTGRWTQLEELRQDLPEYAFYKAIPGLNAGHIVRLREVFGVRPSVADLQREDTIQRLAQVVGEDEAAKRLRLMLGGWLILGPQLEAFA